MQSHAMAGGNYSTVTHFILLGLTDHSDLKVPLFMVFFVIYTITVLGNLGMILLIRFNPQLYTPMYFFLSNLSFIDLCYSSVFAPRLLFDLIVGSKKVSYGACIAQTFLFGTFVSTEGFLLAAMAYDRYIAICNPLLYTVAMPKKVCVQLVAGSYMGGLLNSVSQVIGLLKLSFCGPNIINHYFCDIPPLLKLACSDTHTHEVMLLAFTVAIAASTFMTILISYLYIVCAILRIRSAEGRRKAFSTCASHLTAVTVLYGSVTFSYVQPSSSYSMGQEKVCALFYTLVVPMSNPLIYSLRNKDVKDGLRRAIGGKNFTANLNAWINMISF
ncbi:olfactory receptor 1052-like [Alligator mississippiensis]|uniref:olfactory receptor 1052-like n=1 Tax=Alligator mississippiensis TaxID=8496 RepID=UPI0028777700|nr:olfactory receptor 1052-like [Alligator mississippiensis]